MLEIVWVAFAFFLCALRCFLSPCSCRRVRLRCANGVSLELSLLSVDGMLLRWDGLSGNGVSLVSILWQDSLFGICACGEPRDDADCPAVCESVSIGKSKKFAALYLRLR